MAYRLPEFQTYFNDHWVSCELKSGDAVFFNPALFHAAGENTTTDIQRCANLLQISSSFGRTMETIDTAQIIGSCWDEVRKLYEREGRKMGIRVNAVLNAMGEGYPFPTNLDHRPPAPGGMAPESEVDVLRRGLIERWDTERVLEEVGKVRRDSLA